MNHPLELRLDKNEFLRWVEGQEGRFELKGGRVVMMTGGSRNHARVIAALFGALIKRLDPERWSMTATDLAVEIGEDIRYPDVMVEPQDQPGAERSTQVPVFLAEVLSPSSLALDLNVKAAEYMSLHSLECYLVAAQDEPRLWLWQRSRDAARAFPTKPAEISTREAVVEISCFQISLPLAEIYRLPSASA